jgi:hypothetical protein
MEILREKSSQRLAKLLGLHLVRLPIRTFLRRRQKTISCDSLQYIVPTLADGLVLLISVKGFHSKLPTFAINVDLVRGLDVDSGRAQKLNKQDFYILLKIL